MHYNQLLKIFVFSECSATCTLLYTSVCYIHVCMLYAHSYTCLYATCICTLLYMSVCYVYMHTLIHVCMLYAHFYTLCVCYSIITFIHVLMRDEKEGRKKQARSNKQQGKATQHTQGSHFPLRKMSCLGWDSNPRHSTCTCVDTGVNKQGCVVPDRFRIAGNFRGIKLSRISRIWNHS